MEKDKIIVDGVEYVRADSIQDNTLSTELNGMPYCMVRTYSAGVFAGYVESREGKEATLRNARRIWYWDGAATLSQLAKEGTKKPENCRFTVYVNSITILDAVEIIPCTDEAIKSIEGVREWKC